MAGELFFWGNGGNDVHVLKNPALELATLLQVVVTADPNPHPWSDYVPHGTTPPKSTPPAGVSVTFTTFKQLQTNPHGVTVDPQTGNVVSSANPKVRNFIVTAIIGGVQSTPIRLSIRVFLHDSVSQVQVSPPTLHIPAGTTEGFSVLAVFSDGSEGSVVGDITLYPPLTWAHVGGNTTDVGAPSADGRVTVSPTPSNLTLAAHLRVTLPTSLGTPAKTADADVFPAEGWARDVEVKPVKQATLDKYTDSANVLFLPDGFTVEGDFNRAVEIIVGHLQSSPSSRPYGFFIDAKSMNFYKAWIPSPEEGGTVLNDLVRVKNPDPAAPQNTTITVPIPRDPATKTAAGFNDLNDLLWVVGLPTKTRAEETSFSDQMDEWSTLFGMSETPTLQALWPQWKGLYPRYVAVERDTVFGAAHGRRPQVSSLADERNFLFNPRRTIRDANHIELLLARLYLNKEKTPPNSPRIGRQFVSGGPDARRVYILCNGPITGGMRSDVIMSSLIETQVAISGTVPTGGEIITPVLTKVGNDLPPFPKGTASHEIGHTFHLGDEYAEFLGFFPQLDALGRPRSTAADDFWNLHTFTEIGNPIVPGNIRWGGWKRLTAAATLRDLPVLVQGSPNLRIQIPIKAEHFDVASRIPLDTVLTLRRRPLVLFSGTYAAGKFESANFTLDNVDRDHQLLEGVADDPNGVLVETFVQGLRTDNVAPANVVVTAPRLTRDSAGLETPVTLMHPKIGQVMAQSNTPLNRTQGTLCTFVKDEFIQSPIDFVPGQFSPLRFVTRVVGLYDGGMRYSCGVYHPQGYCQMRAAHPLLAETVAGIEILVMPSKKAELAEFCPVCRYLLVDTIDPSQHGKIDEEYEKQYPQLP